MELIFRIVKDQDRHDGAENLFLHHCVVKSDVIHDRRFDFQRVPVGISTVNHFFRIDQACNAVEVFFVDDLSVIFIGQRFRSELLLNLLFDFLYQLFPDCTVAVNIVGSHAGLSAVQVFSKDDPPGGQLKVGAFFHDAGTLSAKFQGYRC